MRCSGGPEDVWILRTELGRWKKGAVCHFFFGQNKKERKKLKKLSKIIKAKLANFLGPKILTLVGGHQ